MNKNATTADAAGYFVRHKLAGMGVRFIPCRPVYVRAYELTTDDCATRFTHREDTEQMAEQHNIEHTDFTVESVNQ